MRTVQLTLDAPLVADVDKVVGKLKTTRSEFARAALRAAVERYRQQQLEAVHRKGYEKTPAEIDEFMVRDNDRAWGDNW